MAGCDLSEKLGSAFVFVVTQRVAVLKVEAGERLAFRGEFGRGGALIATGLADVFEVAAAVELVIVAVPETVIAKAAALVSDVKVVGAAAAAVATGPSAPFAAPADAVVEAAAVADNVAGPVALPAVADPVAAVKEAAEPWLAARPSLKPAPVVSGETP